MDRRKFLQLSSMGTAGLLCSLGITSCNQKDNPNIILILADDLGWNDVGYHGGVPKTPNIDSLAANGLELDRFYACPICSPTRASLMTGRYSIRDGLMRAVIPPWRKYGLPPEEETMAEMLAKGGYKNRACLGKWHLGHSDIKYHPLNQGFTYFYGCYNGAVDYFTHKREGELDWHRNFEPSFDDGYITDLLSDEAIKYITDHENADSPFFLYLPYTAPHAPNEAPEKYLKMYEGLGDKNKQVHAAMVTAMDDGIGRILDTLDEHDLSDDTLLLFISDNGGSIGHGASNKPLKGQKQEVYEGGVRVPAIARWPGHIQPGKTNFDTPMSIVDIFPTLESITNTTDNAGNPTDGMDLSSIWEGNQTTMDRNLFMYWGQNGNQERLSMWRGDWKLMYIGPDIEKTSAVDSKHLYFYNVQKDPYEKNNLASVHKEKIESMLPELQSFRELRPKDGIPVYGKGSKGFKAPKNWNMKLYDDG